MWLVSRRSLSQYPGMNLAAELSAGFTEAAQPIATEYTLTNDTHYGVIRGVLGNVDAMEPMMQDKSGIVIVEACGNFTRPPAAAQSEIVQVLTGQFQGKWVLAGVTVDNAHYVMTCYASE